mgnify:CR=1 FL=1
MLFNTVHFLIFFVIVTLAYFSLGWSGRWRLLLLASCYFYMIFKPIYFLILLSTIIIDYIAGILLENEQNAVKRKLLLVISLISNIGILVYFKYFNFLNDSLTEVLSWASMTNPIKALDILLPVGLSFHTFQAMSYTIEVYRGNHKAERHFGIYALYVMFYPQLVAGPIERPQNVLYQFHQFHQFNWEKVKSGLFLIAFGLFKKVVIADTCATYANAIFDYHSSMNSLSLILGAVYFAFQIYGDFSGYSDMALGMSKLFGIDLLRNFNYPYFSRDIAEFWRRWHISLSSWFRDYLYIPLGGSSGGMGMKIRNTFIIFLVSGFWHGANWTFIAWGLINAIYFLPLLLLQRNRTNMETVVLQRNWESVRVFGSILMTFMLSCLAWIFFRASSISQALHYIQQIFTDQHFTSQFLKNQRYNYELLFLITAFVVVEWNSRTQVEPISGKYSGVKLVLCLAAILALGTFSDYKEFIYFQF